MGYEQLRREQEERRERKLWSVCKIHGKKLERKERRKDSSIVMASLTNVVLKGPEPMALHVLGRHSLPS